jgi:ubiquinone/menaquinone biosynthesis C-methylase UbiE
MMHGSFSRPSRKERVLAQYSMAPGAAEYARDNDSSTPPGRFYRSRLWLVQDILASFPGGDLLDAGCGTGIISLNLLKSRPHDFHITVLDQSPALVKFCVDNLRDAGGVRPAVGDLESLPFPDASFDVTLVAGALEYTEAEVAVGEISRVTRPGGLVIVSMLNPLSPYRLTEWLLYWPMLRVLGATEKFLGVPAERRHGARASGIRAFPVRWLQRLLRQSGLQPVDLVYFDVVPAVPPFDRIRRIRLKAQRTAPEHTVTRGWRHWMGTAYVVVAKRGSMVNSALTQVGAD